MFEYNLSLLYFLLTYNIYGASSQAETSNISRFTSSKCVGQYDCGEKCIPLYKFRDCVTDCEDASDEACGAGMVKCDGCRCVDEKDAASVCSDIVGTGNKLCRSNRGPRTIYKCNNANCVLYKWISDGSNDCGDWSDEDSCANGLAFCPPGTQCRYQIPNRLFCECPPGFEYKINKCAEVPITTPTPTIRIPENPFPTFNPAQCQQEIITSQTISLSFVIDCSFSMQADLDHLVLSFSTVLFPFIQARPSAIANFVLISVKEGSTKRTITESPLRLLQLVQQLTVEGGNRGNQCSRPLLPSIRQAVASSNPKSTVIVLTDGQFADHTAATSVITGIINRQSKIYFVVTGTCTVPSVESQSAMQTIVDVSNSHIFRIAKTYNDYSASLMSILRSAEPDYTLLDELTVEFDGDASRVQMPLDDSLMAAGIIMTGDNPVVTVNSPANLFPSIQQTSNQVNSGWGHPIGVGQLDIATSASALPYRVTVFGIGGPQFKFKFTADPNAETPVFFNTPWFGLSSYVVIGTNLVGSVIDKVIIKVKSHSTSFSGVQAYNKLADYQFIVGPVNFGCEVFHILVRGMSQCGNTYQRSSTTGFVAKDIDIFSRIPGGCESGQFECIPGMCINVNRLGDGVIDCPSAMDEVKLKTKVTCESAKLSLVINFPARDDWCQRGNIFHCFDGIQCVPMSRVNDGVADCDDGSDENSSVYFTNTPPLAFHSTQSNGKSAECSGSVDSCPPHAVCTSLSGGLYKCVCMFGYYDDGRSCTTPHDPSINNDGINSGRIIQPEKGSIKAKKPN